VEEVVEVVVVDLLWVEEEEGEVEVVELNYRSFKNHLPFS